MNITREKLLQNKPLIIGGPCSIAKRDQIVNIAHEVKKAGGHAVRAQLWKPRTRPDSFQGIGKKGIPWVKEAKEKSRLPMTMEVMSPQQVDLLSDVADIYWVGARNMQNYELLKHISQTGKPVILKRGLIATMKEWLGAAEYIGRDRVILCERGIRTGADAMRFTLDLNAALIAMHDHHMPVIIDPSHTAGRRDMVPHLARAAIAIGAHGVVIETHTNPAEELVDRAQTIDTNQFKDLTQKLNHLHNQL